MNQTLAAPARFLASLILLLPFGQPLTAQESVDSRMESAINAPSRAIAHILRDELRKPSEVIRFMQLPDSGAQVLDLYAADGYYTYLLASAVGPDGRVFAQNPIAGPDADADDIRQMHSLADALDERIALAQLSNVTHLRSDFAKLATSTIQPKSLDAILMSQILHDFANAGEAAAIALLESLRTLLKPSGTLIVIDHAGESGLDNLRLHRMPVEQAKRVAEAAGYTLQAESSLLANPRDRHRRPVFDPMLARNTDRFLLRFQP